jgi:hypothetical protein
MGGGSGCLPIDHIDFIMKYSLYNPLVVQTVSCEQVSGLEIPDTRENTGNVELFRALTLILPPNSGAETTACTRFP